MWKSSLPGKSSWLICRRLYGIAPIIPSPEAHPDDLPPNTRAELDALRVLWREHVVREVQESVHNQTAVPPHPTLSSEERARRGGDTAPYPDPAAILRGKAPEDGSRTTHGTDTSVSALQTLRDLPAILEYTPLLGSGSGFLPERWRLLNARTGGVRAPAAPLQTPRVFIDAPKNQTNDMLTAYEPIDNDAPLFPVVSPFCPVCK
jgi:hypothetical protein